MIKAERFLGMRLVRRIVVGVLLVGGIGQVMADVGRTPGGFDVSSTAAATYTIPLWTPQGPNGMQPNLALSYDSGGANGVLGVGWTLSGLSSIERCHRSRAADAGFTGGPNLSADDRYCLNGNKLRLDTGSPYGSPGTTYRTELHSFATITAYNGSAATGPDYFIMVGNDARTYEFGRTADSRVIVGPAVLRWKLNKVSDTAGNAYLVSYSPETGFAVPTTISWTATAFGQSTYRHVAQLNYSTTRTDTLSAKLASQTLSNNRRLESVEVKSSGTVIRKYVLSYDYGAVSKRSRLTAVKECADAAAAQCLGETTIAYQSGTMGVTSTAYPVVSGITTGQGGENDFDGDGRQDFLFAVSGGWQVAFGTVSGFGIPQGIPTITPSTFVLTGRFTTDGRDGVLALVSGSWRYYGWNGSSFSESAALAPSPATWPNENDATDLDGDGLLDLVWRVGNQVFTRMNTTADASSTPSFSGTSQVGATIPSVGQLDGFIRSTQQDLDGDGRRDVVLMRWRQPPHLEEPLWYAIPLFSRGAVFEIGPEIYLGLTSGNIRFLHFNDDACSDWIVDRILQISQCANTAASAVTFTLPEETYILDWDSDGRDDVLFDSGGSLAVYRSLGTSLDPVPIITSVPYAVGGYSPTDPNGDGVADLIHADAYAPRAVVLYKRSEIVALDALTLAVPDLATKFTDGYGVSYEPKYTTTANSEVYTRGTTLVDELREAPEARVVVRTVIAPDGTGSTFETKYSYAGARSDYWRSETVGFEQRTAIDMRNSLRRRTTFKQGFPFTGLATKDELLKADGVTLISETTNQYDSHSYGQQNPNIGVISQLPFLHVSSTKRYDLGTNALLSTATTTNTIDAASGGLSDQVTTILEAATANGVQAGVEHRYEVHNSLFTASGCAGRPATTQEVRSVTNGATITRKTATTWSASHCRPDQVVVEPDEVQWRITTALAYDAFGNVNQITQTPDASQNQAQRVSAINWGTTGQFPHELTNPESQSTTFVWDLDLGVPTEVIEANGAHSYSSYDEFGRLERETRADGTRTDFALTACSASNSYCSGAADFRFRLNASFYNSNNYGNPDRVDSQYFDAFERPRYSDVTLPDGGMSRTIVTYDALGRVATQTVPHRLGGVTGPTIFAYDLLNRLLTVTRQAGEFDTSPISTVVSYPGLQRQVTDAEGKSRTLTYDAVGSVVRSKDATNSITAYEYDAFGNLLKVTDPSGNMVQMTYSLRGHKLTSNDPDMGEWSYEYFPFGELKSQTDAKDKTVSFEYDRLSRLKKRTDDPEGETTFVYDAPSANGIGQLTTVSGPGGYSENYSYDAIGRLLNRRITISGTDYNYNVTYGVHGQLDTLTYPETIGGRLAVQYSYAKGWLQQVAQGSTVFWHADTLNARGQVTQATLGNGVVRENVIDAITGLVKHIKSGLGGGYGLQNESYLYDDVGNVTQRQNGNPSLVEDFYYDDLHRLDYSKLGGTINMDVGYDELGNITSRSDIAGGAAWTYHASKKHAVTQAGPYSYTYDANGNAITRNSHEIKWTSFNLPYEINGSGKKLTFSYGPDRQRFRQVYQNGSTTETTLYLGGLLEKVEAGGVTDWRHYIVADGEAVAIVSRKNPGTEATWYLLNDHLGSVAKVLNSSGGLYVSESFAAFGARRDSTPWSGPCPCPDLDKIKSVSRRGFTGHEMVGGQSMGLIHMNGRVQDAVIGRFLSPDPFVQAPLNGQSLNRYSYVFNNPLSYTDPSGFLCEKDKKTDATEDQCRYLVDGQPGWWPENLPGSGDHAVNGLAVQRTVVRGIVFAANSPRSDSTAGGTGIGDFFDAYFDRVGGMLYGMADSFKITGEAGPQIKLSATALSFKPELTIGNFSSYLSLSGTLNPEIGVKSPSFGNLYYGEASLSFGKFKVGAALDSVTEGISLRDGPFQRVEQGFFGRTTATAWKSDFGKINGHVQVFFGVKFEWDWYQFFKSVDDAFDP